MSAERPRPQRVGLAAAQRRHPHQPPAARRHAPLRRQRRGRHRRSSAAAPAAACCRSGWPAPAGGSSRSTPARSGIPTATGSATSAARTTCTGPSRASSAATTRCRSARTTPAAASAARWCTSPATRRGSIPSDFRTAHASTASAPTGRSPTTTCAATTSRSSRAAGRRARTGRGATRTATRTRRTRSAATARSSCAAARTLGIDGAGRAGGDHQRPVRQPAALHLPRLLPAGLQGQRQGVAAHHARPRRARARRRGPRRLHGQPQSSSTTHRPRHRRRATSATASSVPAGPHGRRRRLLDRDAAAAAATRRRTRFPDGLGNDYDLVGRYVMVQGAPQTAGRFAEEVRMYKAPPPEVVDRSSSTRPTRPSRTSAGSRSSASSPLPITLAEHVAAQGHWGDVAARVHARLRALGDASARCASSCRCPTTGSPSPTRPTATACRSPTSPTRSATTTGRSMQGGAQRRWRTSSTRPAPRRPSPSTGTRTSSAAAGWARDERDGVVDADLRTLRRPEPLHHRRQRAADPGQRQPGADDHGAGRPGRRPAAGRPTGAGCGREPADLACRARWPCRCLPRADRRSPRRDGTLEWDATDAGGRRSRPPAGARGLGWTYGPRRLRRPSSTTCCGDVVVGSDALDVPAAWTAMVAAVPQRSAGRASSSMAIAAVDIALWDLKAKLLDLPLCRLLGQARDDGAGLRQRRLHHLRRRAAGRAAERWVGELGIPRVKIKIGESWGTRPTGTWPGRARPQAIGADAELFVDANGGYTRGQAVRMARRLADRRRLVRGAGLLRRPRRAARRSATRCRRDVAAGEYGYDLAYFERMCDAGAVDCLQADVTRCAGITELAAGRRRRRGARPAGLRRTARRTCTRTPPRAVPNLRHLEYFHDHAGSSACSSTACSTRRRRPAPRSGPAGPRPGPRPVRRRAVPPALTSPDRRRHRLVPGRGGGG